jgi:hypothetical protein
MELKVVNTFEGSSQPSDVFTPHMPGVDLLSDMDALFDNVRHSLLTGEYLSENEEKGQRAIAIVTPGRMTMLVPCPTPGSMPSKDVASMTSLMPPEPPLNIAVVSYTFLEALMQDTPRCIPFLGYLSAWGYVGHSVVVFEGHSSAFEHGVRNCDVLLVDSGMLPFLQANWVEVAHRVMRPGPKIFVHKRDTYTLIPVVKSGNAQGWRYSEPDGEGSYANCLLTTLAKGTHPSVQVTSGCELPNLADLTSDLEELDWIAGLPFKYDKLNADEIIDIIIKAAGWRRYNIFKTKGVFQARVVTGPDEWKPVTFTLILSKDAGGRRQLQIER